MLNNVDCLYSKNELAYSQVNSVILSWIVLLVQSRERRASKWKGKLDRKIEPSSMIEKNVI
jgi:hypothetical protein